MSLVCSITGRPPKEAVVSPQGCIFGRQEIGDHLRYSDLCPITGEVLSEFSLSPVHSAPPFVVPRTGAVSRSVPMMIKLFRMELDQICLSNLSCRSEIQGIIDEISHLNARGRAADKVIMSLRMEIESSKAILLNLQSQTHVDASHNNSPKRRR